MTEMAYDTPFEEWCHPEELAAAYAHDEVRPADDASAVKVLWYRYVRWRAERMPFESPAETEFWLFWMKIHGPELVAQCAALDGQYRLDFAHPRSRTAIEIDGLAYHGDQAAFRRDRQRDRDLTAAGWRVVRFTAQEVFDDGERCAREALALCSRGRR